MQKREMSDGGAPPHLCCSVLLVLVYLIVGPCILVFGWKTQSYFWTQKGLCTVAGDFACEKRCSGSSCTTQAKFNDAFMLADNHKETCSVFYIDGDCELGGTMIQKQVQVACQMDQNAVCFTEDAQAPWLQNGWFCLIGGSLCTIAGCCCCFSTILCPGSKKKKMTLEEQDYIEGEPLKTQEILAPEEDAAPAQSCWFGCGRKRSNPPALPR